MTEWAEQLAAAQAAVQSARDHLDAALAARAGFVREAHAAGVTIYRISKHIGITQGAVRRILGL